MHSRAALPFLSVRTFLDWRGSLTGWGAGEGAGMSLGGGISTLTRLWFDAEAPSVEEVVRALFFLVGIFGCEGWRVRGEEDAVVVAVVVWIVWGEDKHAAKIAKHTVRSSGVGWLWFARSMHFCQELERLVPA